MRYVVAVEGFEGREIAVELAGFFTRTTLIVDDVPAVKSGKSTEYTLTRNDGREVVASLKPVFFLDTVPQLIVDGKTYQLAEPLKWYQWVWSGIPVALYFSGGLLGALWGMVGLYANSRLFRSKLTPVLQYAATAGVTVLAVVLFLGSAMLFQAAVVEWIPQTHTIRSEDGRFTIEAPVTLQETVEDVDTPTGDSLQIHTYSGERKGIAYFVSYADYPASIVRTNDPEKILEGSRDGVVQSTGGTLIDSSKLGLGTHPGLGFTMDLIDEAGTAYQMSTRLYLVDLRMYEVFVIIPDGTDSNEDVTRFFGSFSVTE